MPVWCKKLYDFKDIENVILIPVSDINVDIFDIYLICVSDIYFDDGRRAGMKNEIRVRPW